MEKLLLAVAVIILLAPSMTKADTSLSIGLGACESSHYDICEVGRRVLVHAAVSHSYALIESLSIEARYDHFSQYDQGEEQHLLDRQMIDSGSIDAVSINLVYTFK